MALDRQSVIRTDFPMSRRGYDRIAVDRGLEADAQQLDGIERPASVRRDDERARAVDPRRRRGQRGRDRAPPSGRRDPRPGRGRPGARACARAGRQALAAASALAARAARRPADRGRGARGQPGRARAAHGGGRADVRPAGHDGVRPDRRGRRRRADRPPAPAPVALRPRRPETGPPHRVAHADACRRPRVEHRDHPAGRSGGARERQARRAQHGRRRAARARRPMRTSPTCTPAPARRAARRDSYRGR